MIAETICARLSANGWSVHARCVSDPKEIRVNVAMIAGERCVNAMGVVLKLSADQKEVVDRNGAARKHTEDRKVVVQVHNEVPRDAVLSPEDLGAADLTGLGAAVHAVASFD